MSVRFALLLVVIGTVIGAVMGGWGGAALGLGITVMVLVGWDEVRS